MRLEDAEIAWADVETTGLNATVDAIIDIAIVRMRGDKIVDYFTKLLNPRRPLSDEIVKLTGLRDEDLAAAEPFSESVGEAVQHFVGDRVVGAYNAAFDKRFIGAAMMVHGLGNWPALDQRWLDPCVLARVLRRAGRYDKGYKLGEIAGRLNVPPTGASHRALADAVTAGNVLAAMARWLPPTVDEVLDVQTRWLALQDFLCGPEKAKRRWGLDGFTTFEVVDATGAVLFHSAADRPNAARRAAANFLKATPELPIGKYDVRLSLADEQYVDTLLKFELADGAVNAL